MLRRQEWRYIVRLILDDGAAYSPRFARYLNDIARVLEGAQTTHAARSLGGSEHTPLRISVSGLVAPKSVTIRPGTQGQDRNDAENGVGFPILVTFHQASRGLSRFCSTRRRW